MVGIVGLCSRGGGVCFDEWIDGLYLKNLNADQLLGVEAVVAEMDFWITQIGLHVCRLVSS